MQPMQMAHDNRQALAGIVHCGLCESPMVRTGTDYTCPTTLEKNTRHHNTIDADGLLKAVLDHVLKLVMTERTVSSVVKDVQKESAEAAVRHRRQLNQTELALEQLQDQEIDLLFDVNLIEPGNDAEELNQVSDRIIALEYEARLSRKELRVLDSAMDEERLRANALNPETYRNPKYPGYTAQIIRTFIQTVEVAPTGITVKFMMPIPTDQEPTGALQDTIPVP